MADVTPTGTEESPVRPASAGSDDLAERLLASVGQGMYVVDRGGRCIFANRACVGLLGYDEDSQLLGRRMHDLVHHARSDGTPYPADECPIHHPTADQGAVHFDHETMFRRDGSGMSCEYWSEPIGHDDEPIAWLVTFLDISARLEAEAELMATMEAGRAANEAKSQLLANMSHELRTPMNAILGYSEMLIEDAEDAGLDGMAADLRKIALAGKHLLSLIDDLLDLSKIEIGRMDFHIDEFDVAELVSSLAADAEIMAAEKGSEVVVEIADDVGTMSADASKVRQAISNLLANAAKFTVAGTIGLTAFRETRPDGDHLVFSVSDTGIGIRPSKLVEIFEEFTQADGSATRTFGGTGLGLPLSRKLCRMMGGDVTVRSEVDVGSTFTIDLPAHVSLEVIDGDTPKTGETSEEELLLVISSDEAASDQLKQVLTAARFGVVAARDAANGSELALRIDPAAILVDPTMSAPDGSSVEEALRADGRLANVPVLAISTADSALELVGAPVQALRKPVDPDALVELAQPHLVTPNAAALVVEDDDYARSLLRRELETVGWAVRQARTDIEALESARAAPPTLLVLDSAMPGLDALAFLETLGRELGWLPPVVVLTVGELTETEVGRLRASAGILISGEGRATAPLTVRLRTLLSARS